MTSDDYIPTTETVADVYATAVGLPEAPKRREWFNRWLTAHDAQVQAEAKQEALREFSHEYRDTIFTSNKHLHLALENAALMTKEKQSD